MTLLSLGKLLVERRGNRGIRLIAAEIGVSPATLSRVERGKLPDLLTFKKICTWLKIDAAEILGTPMDLGTPKVAASVSVHFKADATLSPQAAKDLAELILVAQDEALSEA